jgi:hypothetical protein
MAHQDDRTRIRIQQLHDEYRNKDKYGQSGEEYVDLKLEGEGHEVYDNAPSFEVPSTAMRQNITQRRSQGRAKDRESIGSTSVPIQALLARRSLPRAKDALYQQESSNSPARDIDERKSVTPQASNEVPMNVEYHHSMEFTTPVVSDNQSKAPPDFTFRLIPTWEDDPMLHRMLKKKWMLKKGIEEEMQMASDNGNERKFRQLENKCEIVPYLKEISGKERHLFVFG